MPAAHKGCVNKGKGVADRCRNHHTWVLVPQQTSQTSLSHTHLFTLSTEILHGFYSFHSFIPQPHIHIDSSFSVPSAMSIIYALVAKGTIILAEYTNSSGNFTTGN